MFIRKIFFVWATISMLFLYACGPKAMAPKAELDTPGHHVTNGNKLLEAGKIDVAYREFNRAKELAPKFSPAYVGLGLVDGFNNNFKNSFNNMKEARKYARGDEQKIAVNVGFMRLYIMGKESVDKNWLKLTEEEFDKAILIAKDVAEPYFYMGLAYKMSCKFRQAADRFSRVLELDNGYIAEADKQYALVQKIERAMPGSKIGKKIALVEKITRADVAALFIEELKIDEIFKKRVPKKFDTVFKSPEKQFETGTYVKILPATDIDDHVLKADIDAVIEIGIKGLQPFPDHTYKPYQTITRAEFAMMIEDILIKLTGIDDLATRFIGSVSPFPDLRNDLPYFNAVMICTTRGVMVAKNLSTGEFNPKGPVSGADALLSIRMLKSQL
ncbi:MAG: S-layer homology domain-containing protein [Thermodesulfobacteriota bacterium]|nr:S-layer homology domain-containing protein [Thermodesulfobacteriota bacterium]